MRRRALGGVHLPGLADRGVDGAGDDVPAERGDGVDAGADVVLGRGDRVRVGEIAAGAHGGADGRTEVVGGEDLGHAGGIPIAGVLQTELQHVEPHGFDSRRQRGDSLVGRGRNPDPGIDSDRIHRGSSPFIP